MGNFCFPVHDNDGSEEELALRSTRARERDRKAERTPMEILHATYKEAEQKKTKDIDEMKEKVRTTRDKLLKLREKMSELLRNRDPEEMEPEEMIELQGLMEEESDLTVSLTDFSGNLVTLRKQLNEMERQYTETTCFPPQESKGADAMDVIKLANDIAPQRKEYRKQFTNVLSRAHQQRAEDAEDEKEDLLEGGAASEQLVSVHKFTPEQLDRLKKLRALPPAPTKVPVLKHTIESFTTKASQQPQAPKRQIIPLDM
jgi:hypothetical protein